MTPPRHDRSAARAGLLFAAPALVAIFLFFFLPVVAGLLLSVTDFDIYAVASWENLRVVGHGNYVRLWDDPLFWTALRNTLGFALAGGPATIVVALGAAMLLDARLVRFRAVFRTLFFLPVVTTLVAVAIVWRSVYHPRYGLLNHVLGFVGLPPIDWIGDPRFAMASIVLMSVWKNFGFDMLIFVAALQAIPERLYEAASLDGANRLQQFRHVTLPMLKPTFVFVTVITMVGSLQLFAEPYVMTQGGPGNSTLSLVLLMYQQGFRWWNMGYASTLAFVLFAMILAGTLAQAWLRPAEIAPRKVEG